MDIEDESLDDAIPAVVLRLLAKEFMMGFLKLLPELGFTAADLALPET